MSKPEKPLIIFDTDMDTDCDDTGALAMLLNAQLRKEIRLLGIIADSPAAEAAPCCEAFCRYYGAEVPVGAVYEKDYQNDERFESYREHRLKLKPEQYYNRVLAQKIGKTDTDYPHAVHLYRQLLAKAEDGSVTIVCVGFLTALAGLLDSPADDVCGLNGVELMKRKVQRVISMGELPLQNQQCTSFNYSMDMTGTEIFFEKCPVNVQISPEGTKVITGEQLTVALAEDHPLRMAYECWNGPGRGRSSWDLIAVLQAMRPLNVFQCLKSLGTVHACARERRMWYEADGVRKDQLLLSVIPADEMSQLLNGLIL